MEVVFDRTQGWIKYGIPRNDIEALTPLTNGMHGETSVLTKRHCMVHA